MPGTAPNPGESGPEGKPGSAGDPGPVPIVMDTEDDWAISNSRKKRKIALKPGDAAGVHEQRSSHMKPVALRQMVVPQTFDSLTSISLIAPTSEHAFVRRGALRIKVERNNSALIASNDRCTTVMSLDDGHTGSVAIMIAGKIIPLHAGEQATFSSCDSENTTGNCALSSIAVRGAKEYALGTSGKVLVEDFSIPMALHRIQSLRNLKHSSNRLERRQFHKILKNAAALHQVTAARGPYKTMAAQPKVASRR